ncbi:hypothetical protein [Microbacterium rhizophilus]|uniref:hypothetical protein n=1 Tax=Microbacterium rhizophilus TaxID=3138934 RepID=UPI0031E53228
MPPAGSACTAISTPLPVVMYPAYNVLPMYIGLATNCALTPLIVMLVAARTAAKFAEVMLLLDVVIAVLYVTTLPLYEPVPTLEYGALPAPVLDNDGSAPAPYEIEAFVSP